MVGGGEGGEEAGMLAFGGVELGGINHRRLIVLLAPLPDGSRFVVVVVVGGGGGGGGNDCGVSSFVGSFVSFY